MKKTGTFLLALLITAFFLVSSLYAQDELFEKGRRAYLRGDFKSAVKYLSEYVARTPDPEALYLLGYASYEVKRKTGPAKGRRDFWGDTATRRYFKEAYLIDPNVSARTIGPEKGKK
ncbi:MAG: hypothetical protein M1497_15750 [Nitrospirae bacterium]|nr:hypothetical protein [Nitrospirota bacterium]